MILVLLGAPGTGKGTISRLISEKYNIPCVSTGEMLRKTEDLTEEARDLLSRGELLPDSVINDLLVKRISKEDCANGFILDGYPRTISQAESLDELLKGLNKNIAAAVHLDAPIETIYRRILSRQECVNCRATYSKDTPTKVEGICDKCGSEVKVRMDDNKEALDNRMEVYETKTKPIIEYYKKQDLLRVVDSSKNPEYAMMKFEEFANDLH